MMKFDVSEGLVRHARGPELEMLSLQGWKLVFSFQEIVHEPCMEQEAFRGPNDGYPNIMQVTRYRPNTVTQFVMQKGEAQALEEMQNQLNEAKNEASNQAYLLSESNKALDKVKKELEAEKATVTHRGDLLKRVEGERDRFRQTATKLESDIAKLRKAIGERSFNEILPPEPPAPSKS